MKPEVNLVGRLTRDVTNVFKNPDGSAERALFTCACNSYYKGKDGAKKETVDFIPCICWGGLVSVMTTWGRKGRQVHIRGSLEAFQAGPDNNGKYPPTRIQVKVNELQFLDKKPEGIETPAQTPTPGTSGGDIDLGKLAEMVAAKLLSTTQTPAAQSQAQPNNDEEAANAQAEEAANAQAEAGGDLSSVT